MEGDALIRATLHQNPSELDDDAWLTAVRQAIWVEHYRVGLIGRLFSPKKK